MKYVRVWYGFSEGKEPFRNEKRNQRIKEGIEEMKKKLRKVKKE